MSPLTGLEILIGGLATDMPLLTELRKNTGFAKSTEPQGAQGEAIMGNGLIRPMGRMTECDGPWDAK